MQQSESTPAAAASVSLAATADAAQGAERLQAGSKDGPAQHTVLRKAVHDDM